MDAERNRRVLSFQYTIVQQFERFMALHLAAGGVCSLIWFLQNVWAGVLPNNLVGWLVFGGMSLLFLWLSYIRWRKAELCRLWIDWLAAHPDSDGSISWRSGNTPKSERDR